jgi:hypothetical protein
LDFTRNMFWLARCFSKIKKPNSHFLGNQCGIAGVHDFTFIIVIFRYELQLVDLCGTRDIQSREIQSKRVLGHIKNRHRLADHKKVTQ